MIALQCFRYSTTTLFTFNTKGETSDEVFFQTLFRVNTVRQIFSAKGLPPPPHERIFCIKIWWNWGCPPWKKVCHFDPEKFYPKVLKTGAVGSNRIENGEKGAKNGSKGHLSKKYNFWGKPDLLLVLVGRGVIEAPEETNPTPGPRPPPILQSSCPPCISRIKHTTTNPRPPPNLQSSHQSLSSLHIPDSERTCRQCLMSVHIGAEHASREN